jgi:hypothetical protein
VLVSLIDTAWIKYLETHEDNAGILRLNPKDHQLLLKELADKAFSHVNATRIPLKEVCIYRGLKVEIDPSQPEGVILIQ